MPSIRDASSLLGQFLYKALTLGQDVDYPFNRFLMYEHIKEAAGPLAIKGEKALSISYSKHLLNLITAGKPSCTEANYPEYCISDLPWEDNSFDILVSDQVFEHVNCLPSVAIRESLRVIKPGGYVLHTTCFCGGYHGPGDYWRFTAEGFRHLALMTGASEAISGAEGHPFQLITNFLGWSWLRVPKAKYHPLRLIANLDWPSYGQTVWVLAKK